MADSAGPANPTKPAVLIIGGLGMSFRLLGPVVITAADSMATTLHRFAVKMGNPKTNFARDA